MTEELKACRVKVVTDIDVPKGAWDWIAEIARDAPLPHRRIETPRDAETIVYWRDEQPAAIVLNLRDQFNCSIQYRFDLRTPADAGEVRSDLVQALSWAYIAGATDVHNYWSGGGQLPRGDPEFGEAASDYAKAALDPFSSAARVPASILSLLSPTILVEDVGESGKGSLSDGRKQMDREGFAKGVEAAARIADERAATWKKQMDDGTLDTAVIVAMSMIKECGHLATAIRALASGEG